MPQETYYTNGKNDFKNNVFSNQEWSAPYMVSKEEIQKTLDGFKLEGRRIKDIRFVSHAYNLVRNRIEDYAYYQLKDLPEDDRQEKSDYWNIDPDMQYLRYAELDEPLLIWFEDNDHFEIDAPQEPEFRMSMNCIPWWISPGCNDSNAEAAVLFDSCIGRKIESTEVISHITNKDPMFFSDFPDGEKKELVTAIVLWLENNIGICVEPKLDFLEVTLIDREKEIQRLPFSHLKQALFNWEDIHNDEILGFESDCRSFWFGERGREIIGKPYVEIMPEDKSHSLMIHEDDYALLVFAIGAATGEIIDIYEDYEYSLSQWNSILDQADALMGFQSFDEFFDYLVSLKDKTLGKCDFLYYLNNCGADFWKQKRLHEREAKDLRKWTNLVRKPYMKMLVIGY